MSEAPLLLGIDGGGSKTLALLAKQDGEIIGRGSAGPANYQQIGKDAAWAALDASIAAAFADSGQAWAPPVAACIGLAGVGRPEDRAALLQWAGQRMPQTSLVVVSDAKLVLAAGAPAGWGIALICGTGSIAIGEDAGGRSARVGGWGPVLGDEGSGYAIGQAALRAIMAAYDGRGAPTALTQAVLGHWQLTAEPALVGRVYQARVAPADIAALAPLVDTAATLGDQVADSILTSAGTELAIAAKAVAAALDLDGEIPCALAGGMLIHGARLRHAFLAAAAGLRIHLTPVNLVPVPAEGAICLAQRLLIKDRSE